MMRHPVLIVLDALQDGMTTTEWRKAAKVKSDVFTLARDALWAEQVVKPTKGKKRTVYYSRTGQFNLEHLMIAYNQLKAMSEPTPTVNISMDTLSPTIKLQCWLSDEWQPEVIVMHQTGLKIEELIQAVCTLEERGQIEMAYDAYAESTAYRKGYPERFLARKHPGLNQQQLLDATEYALKRGLLDADIQAEMDAIQGQQSDNQ